MSMVGLDLAKNVFQIHGLDATGREVFAEAIIGVLRQVGTLKEIAQELGMSEATI